MTAAPRAAPLGVKLGVRVVVIEGLTDPAGAHGPSAFAPLSGTPRLATMRASSVLPIAKAEAPAVRPTVEAAPPLSVEPRPRAGETSVCRDRGNQRLRPADHPVKIHVISDQHQLEC